MKDIVFMNELLNNLTYFDALIILILLGSFYMFVSWYVDNR